MATKRNALRVRNALSKAFINGRSRMGVHGVGLAGKAVMVYHSRPNVKKISKKILAALPDLRGVEIRFRQEAMAVALAA